VDVTRYYDGYEFYFQANSYYPSGALVTGIQTSIQLGATSADVQTHKFLGKELDRMHGLDWFDLEARRYDAKVASFTSVDPLCEKYYHISPYSYCAGNPVRYVDPDGRKPRVYIETQGLGHTFVTIGEGKETVVYSYGRYGRLGSLGSVLGSLTSTGEGVLLRKTGGDACKYLETESNKKGIAIFEIENAEDQKVASFFDELWNNGIKSTSSKPAAKKGKVIDQYNLFSNNCTTLSIRGINESNEEELIPYQYGAVHYVSGGMPYKSDEAIIAPITLKLELDRISRNSDNINKIDDPSGFIQRLLESFE
jgi:RHS repeat-associated protein